MLPKMGFSKAWPRRSEPRLSSSRAARTADDSAPSLPFRSRAFSLTLFHDRGVAWHHRVPPRGSCYAEKKETERRWHSPRVHSIPSKWHSSSVTLSVLKPCALSIPFRSTSTFIPFPFIFSFPFLFHSLSSHLEHAEALRAFHFISFYSIPFGHLEHAEALRAFHSIPFHSIPFRSIPFHFVTP